VRTTPAVVSGVVIVPEKVGPDRVRPATVVVVLPRLIDVLPSVKEPPPVLRVEKVEPSRLTLSRLLVESK
jgi:hypothetical protein